MRILNFPLSGVKAAKFAETAPAESATKSPRIKTKLRNGQIELQSESFFLVMRSPSERCRARGPVRRRAGVRCWFRHGRRQARSRASARCRAGGSWPHREKAGDW